MFAHGAIEIHSLVSGATFKVNGHRLKPYSEGFVEHDVEEQGMAAAPPPSVKHEESGLEDFKTSSATWEATHF